MGLAQAAGYDVLLDVATFVPANRLDLGAVKPEFVTVSFYKMFGYPTGVELLPCGGAVRVSLGLVPDLGDLDRLLDFAERIYRDAQPDGPRPAAALLTPRRQRP